MTAGRDDNLKATNAIVQRPGGGLQKKKFSEIITANDVQGMLKRALCDPKTVARFTATMISVVSSSEKLKNCDANTVIASALQGEGKGLIYGIGYSVVPYGQIATFSISYKGMIQLCLSTGLYADIDCIDVREGERRGRDKRNGRPIVDMSVYETDEEREQHPIIGYKAYFELKDGFYREEYWTVGEILRHADHYAKPFSLDLYTRWQNGEVLNSDEQRTVTTGSPWYTATDKMMKKTVLRSLLNSGYAPMSPEVRSIISSVPEGGEGVIPDVDLPVVPPEQNESPIDGGAAEVVHPEAPIINGDAAKQEQPQEAAVKNTGKAPASGRKSAGRAVEVMPDDGEFAESFFDQ